MSSIVNKGLSSLEKTLRVSEVFTSIQGEGRHSGLPCFFIRLTGCNLRCSYCDTKYAYYDGKPIPIKELLRLWEKSGLRLVQITGGEPLLSPNVYDLLDIFLANGAKCILETNGSLSISNVPPEVIKVLDWKTPGSGVGQSFLKENLRYISFKDQIKFVITSEEDYRWAKRIIEKNFLSEICEVLVSPAWGQVDAKCLANWVIEDKLQARFQIQLHKFLWGDKRGV